MRDNGLALQGRRVGQPAEGRVYFHGGDVGDGGDPSKSQQVMHPRGRREPRHLTFLGALTVDGHHGD